MRTHMRTHTRTHMRTHMRNNMKATIVTFGTFRSVLPLSVIFRDRPPPVLDPSWTQKLVQKRAPKIDPL